MAFPAGQEHPARHNRIVQIIIALFILLAAIYGWATPIFEASDELWHFGMVEHLALTNDLPVQVPGEETAWAQEGSQPPLYYFLSSLLIRPFDISDTDMLREPNPHVKAGVPGDYDNKNLVLHDTLHPAPQRTALAVYLIRAFSIALSVVTLLAVHATASLCFPQKPGIALLALGLTAFNPMFLFISASVNNESLVVALNNLIMWQIMLLMRDGFSTRRSLLIALIVALTSLAKLSGLVMIPTVAAAGLFVAIRRRNLRGLVLLGGLIAAAWVLVAGWWYLRNVALYGELFGTRMMVAVAGPRLEPFTLGTLLAEFEGFRVTYWGLFGAVNILNWPGYYLAMDALTVAALIGLGILVWRSRHDVNRLTMFALMGLTLLVGSIGVIGWTSQTYASQGRLLFPFFAATSTLLAAGLAQLRLPTRPAIVVLAVIAAVIPFGTIAPAYAPPPTATQLPASAQPVYARFGDVVLVGYEAVDTRYSPGDYVSVTLYWQVENQSERDLSLYVHAVDENGTVLGKIDTFPGAGRLRTSSWQHESLIVDQYQVPLDEDAAGQSALRISIGWWDYPTQTYITPAAEDGTPLESVMLNAGGFSDGKPLESPEALTATDRVNFGRLVDLEGYALSADNVMTLAWKSTGNWQADYTVFVQVLDAQNAIVGQGDAPPHLPTRYWRGGEQYLTQHSLYYAEPLQAGTYRIVVGWYSPVDFARLGTDHPDAAFELTQFTIE